MAKVIQLSYRNILHYLNKPFISKRTFLSNAYYCREVWESRLKKTSFENINLDDFYHDLDQVYQKNRNISPVDVDIFANCVQDDNHTDELLDLVHKLRLSAESSNMLESTPHSLVRLLLNHKHYDKLLQVLDDRLNYGIFLDYYTANILLDTFWKNKDYISGSKIAVQLMLQEDFYHPMNLYLSLLHCYKYLVEKPEGWTKPADVPEPEEEIKIRVKYIRNPYFDDHFDLVEPNHLLGKTLYIAGQLNNDSISKTFQLIGLELFEKREKAKELLAEISKNNCKLCINILTLLPEDNETRIEAEKLNCEEINVEKYLTDKVLESEKSCNEKDIVDQCKLYERWDQKRQEALETQKKRLEIAEKLTTIEEAKKKLDEKELKLWYSIFLKKNNLHTFSSI